MTSILSFLELFSPGSAPGTTVTTDHVAPTNILASQTADQIEAAELLAAAQCDPAPEIELLSLQRGNSVELTEFLSVSRGDRQAWVEGLGGTAGNAEMRFEISLRSRRDPQLPVEWSGAALVLSDGRSPVEFSGAASSSANTTIGVLAAALRDALLFPECLATGNGTTPAPIGAAMVAIREAASPMECSGNIVVPISGDTQIEIEWTGTAPLLVSVDRVLQGLGRVRLLRGRHRARILTRN